MKVVVTATNTTSTKVPLLPLLDDPEDYKLNKGNSITYKLSTPPTEANAPKYKRTVRVLEGTESVRQILKWRKDCDIVASGLAVTDLADKKH